MGVRQERLADEIRDILASCFLADQMSDPRLSGITITHVKLTKDLDLATVYFRLFDPSKQDEASKGLIHCKGFLRSKMAEGLKVRKLPDLRFKYDESVDYGARIEELVKQTKL